MVKQQREVTLPVLVTSNIVTESCADCRPGRLKRGPWPSSTMSPISGAWIRRTSYHADGW
jgi:hypothetical protein